MSGRLSAGGRPPRVLVTSAVGKTGRQVVRHLLRTGLPVRAMVRRDDARATLIRAQGAEVVVGDLRDIGDLRRAMAGVQRAYWAGPIAATTLEAAVLFASAAEDARLEVIVSLSQWLADPAHPSLQTRVEWETDRIFSWLPSVSSITVDPGFFAENYLVTLPLVAQLGVLTLPYGDGLNAPPSNEDIGAVAGALLVDPEPHLGRRYRPTGPALVSTAEVADVFARVLGRTVRYQDVPFAIMQKAAVASGFDAFTVAQLRWYVPELRAGTFAIGAPTTAVEDFVHRPAESMETIIRRAVSGSSHTHRTPRALAGAIALLAKTAATPTPSIRRYLRAYEAGMERSLLAQDFTQWKSDHQPQIDVESRTEVRTDPES